mmetsp:Transcript_31952/g.76092  ORF Transcript_31952/g.76092 Transcript_31952/m.76092 type:complete len:302 (-) Transcript_31952:2804-3709(-)
MGTLRPRTCATSMRCTRCLSLSWLTLSTWRKRLSSHLPPLVSTTRLESLFMSEMAHHQGKNSSKESEELPSLSSFLSASRTSFFERCTPRSAHSSCSSWPLMSPPPSVSYCSKIRCTSKRSHHFMYSAQVMQPSPSGSSNVFAASSCESESCRPSDLRSSTNSPVSMEPDWSRSKRMKTRCMPWCCHQSRNSRKSIRPELSASSSSVILLIPSSSIDVSPSSRSSSAQSAVLMTPAWLRSYLENLACTESVRISATCIGFSKLSLSYPRRSVLARLASAAFDGVGGPKAALAALARLALLP